MRHRFEQRLTPKQVLVLLRTDDVVMTTKFVRGGFMLVYKIGDVDVTSSVNTLHKKRMICVDVITGEVKVL